MSSGRKQPPVDYYDNHGYIVPYEIMLEVYAQLSDSPQTFRESTKL